VTENIAQLVADAVRAVFDPIVKAAREREHSTPVEIIRPKDLQKFTGLRSTARDDAVARGDLPRPVAVGERAVGFLASEIAAWQRRKIAERDAKLAAPSVERQAPPLEPEPAKIKKRRLRPNRQRG
jgi:prophage regulatory protein